MVISFLENSPRSEEIRAAEAKQKAAGSASPPEVPCGKIQAELPGKLPTASHPCHRELCPAALSPRGSHSYRNRGPAAGCGGVGGC